MKKEKNDFSILKSYKGGKKGEIFQRSSNKCEVIFMNILFFHICPNEDPKIKFNFSKLYLLGLFSPYKNNFSLILKSTQKLCKLPTQFYLLSHLISLLLTLFFSLLFPFFLFFFFLSHHFPLLYIHIHTHTFFPLLVLKKKKKEKTRRRKNSLIQ